MMLLLRCFVCFKSILQKLMKTMESWGTELDSSYLLVTQFFQVYKSTVLVSTLEGLHLNIKHENA